MQSIEVIALLVVEVDGY